MNQQRSTRGFRVWIAASVTLATVAVMGVAGRASAQGADFTSCTTPNQCAGGGCANAVLCCGQSTTCNDGTLCNTDSACAYGCDNGQCCGQFDNSCSDGVHCIQGANAVLRCKSHGCDAQTSTCCGSPGNKCSEGTVCFPSDPSPCATNLCDENQAICCGDTIGCSDGSSCTQDSQCSGGSCCGGRCSSLVSDSNNCGTCGNVCAPGYLCDNSACIPDGTGFVPPDANTGKCEDLVAAHLKVLFKCMTNCQIKQADKALKGIPFDEEACEEGTGKPVSCRTSFNNATAKLLARTPAICPPCLDATAQSNLADAAAAFAENASGPIYCAGTTPFGGDDPGFVPPDANTAKCEDLVAAHLKTLFSCTSNCRIKHAGNARKGKPFDEEECETGTGKPASCWTSFNKATTKLLARTSPICPTCLDATAQSDLANTLFNFIDDHNGAIYCAGTTPLP